MPVDDFYQFEQIQLAHRPWVGDKSFYLGLLAQQGYPVLPGLVISAKIFQNFLEQIQGLEPLLADLPNSSLSLDVDNSQQLQAIAQRIRLAIQSASLSESWLTEVEAAVGGWQSDSLILRPSLALSTQLDPTLSARTTGLMATQVCWTNREAIAYSIKQIWAELFRAKSLFYWRRSGIQMQQLHLAVLVQPLGNAIASGEVRLFEQSLEIRAVWGLGKALVNGEASPSTYTIQEQTAEPIYDPGRQNFAYCISDKSNISDKSDRDRADHPIQLVPLDLAQQTRSPLNSQQIQQLLALTQKVTAVLKMPVELEWTLVSLAPKTQPTFYLTQVIPQVRASLRALHPAPRTTVEVPPLQGLAAAPGQVTAIAWVVDSTAPFPTNLPAGGVLVTQTLSPDWLLHLKWVGGVITEQGGMTSHAAIVAREMGIPAVLGIAGATRLIRTGDRVRVDGDRGEVYQVDQATLQQPEVLLKSTKASSPIFTVPPDRPTQIMLTLSQPEAIAQAASLPVDGVGLLRSELMLLEALDRQHPKLWVEQGRKHELIDRIAQQIRPFVEAFNPRPVFYRSLDLRSHEFSTLAGQEPSQRYPMLGVRGTLSYQRTPAQFEVELLALRQVQQWGYGNVHLLLPFVRTVEEFIFCRQMVERVGLTQNPNFQLWIMAEVPSVLLLLPDYVAAGVQGIAIGSNDLTQLMLGVDREHPDMAIAFDQHHPVIMRALQQLIRGAQQAGIPCTLCGQAASQHPEMIAALIGWGITAISVSPNEVEQVSGAIARAGSTLAGQPKSSSP